MLRIRLTRIGKKQQPAFRLVVAEHSFAVKGKYLELLGHYLPAKKPKTIELNKERIEYWLSKGAQPSETAAALLKNNGFSAMEPFLPKKNRKRTKKKGGGEEGSAAPAEGTPNTES